MVELMFEPFIVCQRMLIMKIALKTPTMFKIGSMLEVR